LHSHCVSRQCCGARSSDFDSFVKLPGCKRGPHTAITVAAPAAAESTTIQRLKAAADAAPAPAQYQPVSVAAPISAISLDPIAAASPASYDIDSCPRCKQGFACQEHGVSVAQAQANVAARKAAAKAALLADPKKSRACKNAGCGLQYTPNDQVIIVTNRKFCFQECFGCVILILRTGRR
jgi:hypothetical protein